MIQDFIKKVGEFHDAFGVQRGNVDVELRYKLFKEEFEEYKDAKTLVDKADAIIDMLYIACGTIDLHEWDIKINHKISDVDPLAGCIYSIYSISEELESYLKYNNKASVTFLIIFILDLAVNNNIYNKLPQLFEAVHESNMSKLDENGTPIINDGILDPSKPIGKILKGKNYFEPRLKEILENGN